jgi:CBS domain-containing protein
MAKHQVSGIAIVDEDGRLLSTFSTTDFTHLMAVPGAPSVPAELFLPLHISLLRQAAQSHRCQAPVSVRTHDPLSAVVKKMAMFRVHRVWVVDGDDKPVGIITPFEVLRAYLNE